MLNARICLAYVSLETRHIQWLPEKYLSGIYIHMYRRARSRKTEVSSGAKSVGRRQII